MALPTVVGVGAVGFGIASVGSAQGLTLPAGLADNDILVCVCESQTSSATAPANWGVIGSSVIVSSGTLTRLTLLWRRVPDAASEPVPTIPDAGDHIVARIIAIRGCAATGDPWNVTSSGTELVADTSVSITGATPNQPDNLVLVAFSTGSDITSTAHAGGWTNAGLLSFTERMDNWRNTGNGGGFGVATGTRAAATAYPASTATCATANFKAFMTVAFHGAATQSAEATPAVVLGSVTIPGPTESAGSRVTPDVIDGLVSIPTPTVIVPDAPAAPQPILATTSIPARTVSAGARPTPAVVSGAATVPAAQVRTGARPTPSAILGVTTLPARTVSAGARPTPAVVSAVTTIPAPAVSGGTNANVTPAVILGAVAIPGASAGGGVRVEPEPIELDSTIPAAIVTTPAGVNITPGVVTGATTIPARTIRTGARPTPGVVHGAAAIGIITIPPQTRRRTARPFAGTTARPRGLV